MALDRILVALAGLSGAAGVGLSAAAAHAGGGNLATAAAMLLAHAPALLAIGLFMRTAGNRLLGAGALVLALGLLLFCGDLLARHYLGGRLFPMAAPAGGMALIAGWLLVAASALMRGEPKDR